MDNKLTENGWPRPVINGLPIPWVSPAHDLSALDEQRLMQLKDRRLCQVCGEGHANDAPVYLCVSSKEPPNYEKGFNIIAMDDAVLHKRCMLLAIKTCPRLRELSKRGLLRIMKGTVEDIVLLADANGVPRLGAYGSRAAVVR